MFLNVLNLNLLLQFSKKCKSMYRNGSTLIEWCTLYNKRGRSKFYEWKIEMKKHKKTLVNERELSKQSVLFNEDPDHTFYFIADQDLLCSLKTFLKNTICSSFPFSLTFKRSVCPIRHTNSRWLCTVIIRGRQATVLTL